MKLIIELDDKDYELAKADKVSCGYQCRHIIVAVKNGTPYNPSGDLISRKDLQAKHDESCAGECACCAYGIDYTKSSDSKFHCLLIDNAPTVDLWQMRQEAIENALKKAEVLYGRPQGSWETDNIGIYCSVCKRHLDNKTPFCPLCGADMRGGAE